MAVLLLTMEYIRVIPNKITTSFSERHDLYHTDIFVIYILGVIGFFTIVWFITSEMSSNIKKRESILLNQKHKLIEMDKEKNKLTTRATHELKAPFAAISSYLYTMRDGYCGELPDKADRIVHKMIDRCDQLTQKITDIIHLSNLKYIKYKID